MGVQSLKAMGFDLYQIMMHQGVTVEQTAMLHNIVIRLENLQPHIVAMTAQLLEATDILMNRILHFKQHQNQYVKIMDSDDLRRLHHLRMYGPVNAIYFGVPASVSGYEAEIIGRHFQAWFGFPFNRNNLYVMQRAAQEANFAFGIAVAPQEQWDVRGFN